MSSTTRMIEGEKKTIHVYMSDFMNFIGNNKIGTYAVGKIPKNFETIRRILNGQYMSIELSKLIFLSFVNSVLCFYNPRPILLPLMLASVQE